MAGTLFDLSGRRILITGSSMGIGQALARGLGEHGASIVLNARNAERLDEAAEALRGEGLTVETAAFDVTDAEAVKAAVSMLEEAGPIDGLIINIASVQSALARPGIAPYTATKGAVANLTKGMATDWAKYGLQVNAIAPGYFKTPLNQALVDDPAFTEWLEKRTPAGRWGTVDELVGAAVFLMSDGATFVNGHTLYVDGGITASL